jgi:hypothetical protein
MKLIVFIMASFFLTWVFNTYVFGPRLILRKKMEARPAIKREPTCECGHTRDEHSPCSPMGCTKCNCWRTPTWIRDV